MSTILTFQINLLSVIRLSLPLHEGEYAIVYRCHLKMQVKWKWKTPNQLIMILKDIESVDNKSENEFHFQNGTKTD